MYTVFESDPEDRELRFRRKKRNCSMSPLVIVNPLQMSFGSYPTKIHQKASTVQEQEDQRRREEYFQVRTLRMWCI